MDQLNAISVSAEEVTVVSVEEENRRLFVNLTDEYECTTPSEKSLAYIASVSYNKYLALQDQIRHCDSTLEALSYSHVSCEDSDFHPKLLNNACKRTEQELKRRSLEKKQKGSINNTSSRYKPLGVLNNHP